MESFADVNGGRRFAFDLAAGASAPFVHGAGWAKHEPIGVWSDGPRATAVFVGLEPGGRYNCAVSGRPHIVPPVLVEQHLQVFVEDQLAFQGSLDEPARFSFAVTANSAGIANLTFHFPNAIAPCELGRSGDTRKLGLLVQHVEFTRVSRTPTERVEREAVEAEPEALARLGTAQEPTASSGRPREPSKRALVRRRAVHEIWSKLDTLLEQSLQRSSSHLFMDRFFSSLGGGAELFVDFVHRVQRQFEGHLNSASSRASGGTEIPPLTHRIWVTSRDTPAMPPAEYLDDYIRVIRDLPADTAHFFWTNSASVRAHLSSLATAAKCHDICVMDTDIFCSDALFPTVDRLLQDRKFVLAADVLKMLILHRFGGIYSDLGIAYDENIFHLARNAEYTLLSGTSGFFQTSFVACAPRSDLISAFLAVQSCPAAFNQAFALTGSAPGPMDEVNIFAGPGFTVCAMLFLGSARTVLLPPQSPHLMWRSQQSWYGDEPKHGNAIVSKTQTTIIEAMSFGDAERNFQDFIHSFGNSPLMKEQLRILLATKPHFLRNPTKFCRVLFYNGSDKAQAWHDYGYIYNYILGQRAEHIGTVLEVGIGTNHAGMPSTMGIAGVPGASLRAWRDLFPNALIIGADVDKRTMIEESRIKTFFVDQTDLGSIARLFEDIGERTPDLIIDDGLHTFAANKNLFLAAYPRLAPGGLYVIEDVDQGDIRPWLAFLTAGNYDGAIINIPNPTNKRDNCLILVHGRART